MWYDESGALAIFHIGFTIYKPIGAKPQSSGLLNLACFSAKGALLERTQVPSFANTTARGAARQTAPKRARKIVKIVKFSKKRQKILTFCRLPRFSEVRSDARFFFQKNEKSVLKTLFFFFIFFIRRKETEKLVDIAKRKILLCGMTSAELWLFFM